jgi:hypothetical protein
MKSVRPRTQIFGNQKITTTVPRPDRQRRRHVVAGTTVTRNQVLPSESPLLTPCRVTRSTLFTNDLPPAPSADPTLLALLLQNFPFELATDSPPPRPSTTQSTSLPHTVDNEATEFNLFSTDGPAKVDLSAPVYEVPLINRIRPKEYYFTSP